MLADDKSFGDVWFVSIRFRLVLNLLYGFYFSFGDSRTCFGLDLGERMGLRLLAELGGFAMFDS